ncbi:MAG: hypothetical protein IGS48_01480 [Oscillatoriales cyanobacterium C42_A2020_001]|nr:hypothetical protein [Leptolyngbyaceae cyanobacterium C42_A2020_001]
MSKPLDEARSRELSQQVKSKSKAPFENAHRAALAVSGAQYVQGFLVLGNRSKPLEHAWIELEECILDPSLPFLNQPSATFHYFPVQRLTVKQLKAAIEEAKEDYPDDPPLPIYGAAPYEYYGDVMLGGRDYQQAFEAAQRKCQESNVNGKR